MDFSGLTLFKNLGRRMDWLSQRQTVLSQNIAHADTPEYRPRDLEPQRFDKLVDASRIGVKRTHAAHLAGPQQSGEGRSREDRIPYETSPSGNAVVLEEQMIKATETAIDHITMTSLYARSLGLVRTALGTRNG